MMIDTLKKLCSLSGVSGNENEVSQYIQNRAKAACDDVSFDVMGNIIVNKKGAKTPKKKIMLCAHMDEVGIIITYITDDGYLKFQPCGAADKRVVIGKSVTIGINKVFGVIGCSPIHLLKDEERSKAIDFEDMCIDIGRGRREEAEKLVSPGDTGTFDDSIFEFGDGFLKAKAIDDRFGCAVMLSLIESDIPIDCTFVFTVQEEVGLRGAHAAAFSVAPDIAVIIEATTAADLPSVSGEKKVCKLGGGAVIPFMDSGTIYNKELYTQVTSLAEKNNIPWQTKSVVAGGTDGGVIHRSRSGVKTIGIAAPVRNLHTQSGVAKYSDLEAVYKLTELFLKEQG
jgi:endoglucanase